MVPVAPVGLDAVNVLVLTEHVPEMHTSPDVQTFPHTPQFELSLLRSVHVPEHITDGEAHVHELAVHVSYVPHFVVHAPQ